MQGQKLRARAIKGLIPVYKRKKQIINIIINDYIYFCAKITGF